MLVMCSSSCRRRSQRRSSLRTFGVERAEGLVRAAAPGLDARARARRYALPLAAGELGREAVGQPVELHS